MNADPRSTIAKVVGPRLLLCALALQLALGANANPRDKVHPKCPTNNPSVSWRDYMSGKLPWEGGKPPAVASVVFRNAKALADPEAIGKLPTNACYLIIYLAESGKRGAKGYRSVRAAGPPPIQMSPLPGDPEEYEINVHGVLLLFNEAGEVLDRRGRPVGNLICYILHKPKCAAY